MLEKSINSKKPAIKMTIGMNICFFRVTITSSQSINFIIISIIAYRIPKSLATKTNKDVNACYKIHAAFKKVLSKNQKTLNYNDLDRIIFHLHKKKPQNKCDFFH